MVGKRSTSPTVPMILAASMGPMPKILVRVVPEASISASMRPLRSAIFLSSVLILSARSPRPNAGAGGPRCPWDICRAGYARPSRPRASRLPRRGGGPAGARAGSALSALVRSATRSSLLSENRCSASDAASGSTTASRPLREAASAVARASLYGGTQAENKPTHLSWATGSSRAIPV